jgi:hypothetical protein
MEKVYNACNWLLAYKICKRSFQALPGSLFFTFRSKYSSLMQLYIMFLFQEPNIHMQFTLLIWQANFQPIIKVFFKRIFNFFFLIFLGDPINGDHLVRSMLRSNTGNFKFRYIGPEWSFLAIFGKNNYKKFFQEVKYRFSLTFII